MNDSNLARVAIYINNKKNNNINFDNDEYTEKKKLNSYSNRFINVLISLNINNEIKIDFIY